MKQKLVSFVVVPLAQLSIAFLLASLIVLIIGESPIQALKTMIIGNPDDFVEGIFSRSGLSGTLFYATSFIFTGLAVAVAFHAGLFNIGGEGQALLGGLGVSVAIMLTNSLSLTGVLGQGVLFILVVLFAAFFGGLWGAIPGYLQAKRGAHIVVTTIMLNFIASSLVQVFANIYALPGSIPAKAYRIPSGLALPSFDELTGFNPLFFLALFVSVVVWGLIWRTRLGYRIRVVGQNPTAASYAGISKIKILVIAMLISGVLAGLMATNVVYGQAGYLSGNGFVAGFGFLGIAVALMGRNHPVGIVLAAILFGALYQGATAFEFSSKINLPKELVIVIQGIIVFIIGALDRLIRRPIERIFGFENA